jgi:hypothetical protein
MNFINVKSNSFLSDSEPNLSERSLTSNTLLTREGNNNDEEEEEFVT